MIAEHANIISRCLATGGRGGRDARNNARSMAAANCTYSVPSDLKIATEISRPCERL
jgi:hypothetical protein